jgi:hypothetical protein
MVYQRFIRFFNRLPRERLFHRGTRRAAALNRIIVHQRRKLTGHLEGMMWNCISVIFSSMYFTLPLFSFVMVDWSVSNLLALQLSGHWQQFSLHFSLMHEIDK